MIGTRTSYINEKEVFDHVAGFCVCNDVSEREFQTERGGQWMKGKGCATFGPLGPWLVTPDEIADVQKLGMWLDVNGKRMQTGITATMIFNVVKLVSYISHFMVLEPGDVITTGTPPGVGMGMKPPVFLKAGDIMRLGIDGPRHQKQTVVAWSKGLSTAPPGPPPSRGHRRRMIIGMPPRERSATRCTGITSWPGARQPACRMRWPARSRPPAPRRRPRCRRAGPAPNGR